MSSRSCQAITKQGKPCGAPPLRAGTEVGGIRVSGQWCRQHDQDLPDSARIGGRQPGAGRPRRPRVTEVLRERIEEETEAILAPFFDATRAENPDGSPNHAIRLKAAEALLDRAYGRPRQTTEHSIEARTEIPEIPDTPERNQEVLAILEDSGALDLVLQDFRP